MKTLCICSAKGGVGKTTVALNLALAFADAGKRILLVDCDPQGGIGHALGKGDTELAGLAEYIMGQSSVDEALMKTKHENLTLLPRGRLDPVHVPEYEAALLDANTLSPLLKSAQLQSQFDLILLDTPSGLGSSTRGALRVADFALLPFQSEPMALRSLSQTLRVIDFVRRNENTALQLLAILPTMVDKSSDASQNALQEVWSDGDLVTDTVIPRALIFSEASANGLPLAYLAGPMPIEARRFELLASELNQRMLDKSPKSTPETPRKARALL